MRTIRGAGIILMLAAIAMTLSGVVSAHSGLRFSSPLDDATLGDSPAAVVLTFWEKPEPSLSTIRVVDTSGVAYHGDRPQPVEGDPLSLKMPVKRLGRGVYTVHWRVVSAVDGHASAGAFAFGVLMAPTGVARTEATPGGPGNYAEGGFRAVFILGVMLLLGGAIAAIARFGGGTTPIRLAGAGWILSAIGLGLLVWVQHRATGVTIRQLLATGVGEALIWRATGLAVAGLAVGAGARARENRPLVMRAAATVAALAAIFVIFTHSASGHAAALAEWANAAVAVHTVHFAAVAIWLGGLTALVRALRSSSHEVDARDVRRFSSVAAAGIAIAAITGVLRTLNEIGEATELIATPYGRVLTVKIVLFAIIAALGARNRWRHIPLVDSQPERLRRGASIELGVAAVVVVAAGLLGALAPPAATRAIAGIVATGEDFGTTVRVRFTAASDQPGPNRFELQVLDYDSREPVGDARVRLQFRPLDDPREQAATLPLTHGGDGLYAGSGPQLSFEGRWQADALIERGRGSVTVPIVFETRSQPRRVGVVRPPGVPPTYMIELKRVGNVHVTADPARAGGNRLHVTFLSGILEPLPVEDVVVTLGAGAAARRQQVQRAGTNTFVVLATLPRGDNRLAVIGHAPDGTRIYAVFTMSLD